MTVLPAHMYRDPALVVEDAEARTCAGCMHTERLTIGDETRVLCLRGNTYGRRCRQYREQDPNARVRG